MSSRYFVCRCFYTDNFFLKRYNLHFHYESDEQIRNDYTKILHSKGCKTEGQLHSALQEIQSELKRRQELGPLSVKRKEQIAEQYKPLHPHVYQLQESYLAQEFLELVKLCKLPTTTKDEALQKIMQTSAPEVYSFPVFTKSFCQDLIQELCHFEQSDMPKGRPNTMNNYGILLDELGFDPGFLDPLRTLYLEPLSRVLFPEWTGSGLDSHKAFTVQYKLEEDRDLSYHYDNAEVTLNVSLGKDFVGGNLYFGDMKEVELKDTECAEVEHKETWGLFHRGQHKHGAMPIQKGERYNLIIWMRASSIRNKHCPMCWQVPTLVETVGRGDGFTPEGEGQTVNVCSAS